MGPRLVGGGHGKGDDPEAVGNGLAQKVGAGDHEIELTPEPPGAHREVFMVRPAVHQSLGALGDLQWSLADRF